MISLCSIAQNEKSHRLKFLSDNLQVAQTYCSQQLPNTGSRFKINIIGKKLQVGKIYLIKIFDKPEYFYVLFASDDNLYGDDEDEVVNGSDIGAYIFCDRDGDGVEDSQDNCPDEVGPVSNNGCPVQLKKPNLKLKSLKVTNTTTNKVIFNFPNGNTNTPTLKNTNWYDFSIEVENNVPGSSQANPVSLDMLINTSSTLYPDPRASVFNVSTDSNIGSISAGGSITKTFSVFVSNTIGSSPSLSNGNGYTLSIDIDQKGRINESNENDNISQLQFIYSSSSKSNIKSTLNQSSQKPYEVSVFTISGTQIIKEIITNKNEERKLLINLPSGFYIIKNGTDTYKVAKE